MSGPLAGLRVVATLPPHTWFGGVDFNFAIEMAGQIRDLGASVLEIDIGGFFVRNELYIEQAVQAVKAFHPDVAVAVPNAGYGLLCRTPGGENVFKDILQIPTLMLWDHGLLQFPKLCLNPLPKAHEESKGGSIQRLKSMLDHELFIHYSPDSGHIAVLDSLGVVPREKVHFFLQPAYPNFVRHAYRTPPNNAYRTRLAFAGNVYLKATRELPFRGIPSLKEVEERVVAAKAARLTDCLWDIIATQIETLSPKERKRLKLEPDETFFWSFIHDEIEVVGNTRARLDVLAGLQRECEFFGNFIEPDAASTLREQYRLTFRKCLDYFTELPLLFMNSDIVVDVINLGYNTGISPKVMGCMACGGMVLFDYKEDFRASVGPVADEVMYRSVEHLNELIERYLSNPRKRQDVARCLQHCASTKFSFEELCRRLFIDEPLWR